MVLMRKIGAISVVAAILAGCVADNGSSVNSQIILGPENSGDNPSENPGEDSGALPYIGSSSVIFTEVDPINLVLEDHEGDDAGWVELFNASTESVDLEGLALTDDKNSPNKWTFGKVVIPPNSFQLVYLSGKNYPDFVPPSDSTDMIGSGCWSWTDSQNEPVAGFSYANPLAGQTKQCYKEDGKRVVGSVMKYGDNEELGWTSIAFMVGTGSTATTDVADISNATELLLTGYIEKDRVLQFHLAQPDLDDWKGWHTSIVGNGEPNATYRVALPRNSKMPDLENIYGTRFSPDNSEVHEITFKLTSYIARNGGHEPHANFKASKKGGSLYLVKPGEGILDSVAYPTLPIGKTWSWGEDSGKMGWGYAEASPKGLTQGSVVGTISPMPMQEFPSSGFYKTPFALNFNEDEQVRCGLGGAAPDLSSPVQTSITVEKTTVLRCVAAVSGRLPSEEITRTYVFEDQPATPVVFVTSDPGSLFDPDTGIYMTGPNAQTADPHYGANYWLDKELPVTVELFEPGVSTPAFAEKAGFKIFGNYSRMNKKKSVSITFREKYGNNRLKYPLFPDHPEWNKFKVFVLRSGGSNFGRDYIRDRLGSAISDGLGVDYQHGRGAVVYYNGEYYGIHNIRERSTEYYFETHYGLDPDYIDLLKADNAASAGSSMDYESLMAWLGSHSLEEQANYDYVVAQLDVDNLMNYMATEMFADNRDWPSNNLKKWRSTNPVSKWKWFFYDMDFGFDSGMSSFTNNIFEFTLAEDGDSWPNGPESTLLFRKMMENPGFRTAFINRFNVLLSMNFESSRVLALIDAMVAETASELERDQKRWNLSSNEMSRQLTYIKNFAEYRQNDIRQEMKSYFGLGEYVPVILNVEGPGKILVHDLSLDNYPMTVYFNEGHGVLVTAKSAGGVFTGWSDGVLEESRVILPGETSSVTAIFH